MSKKTIEDLRSVLFDTIDAVKEGKMDIDRAKTISDLAQVMVNTAKVEVEHAKVTGQNGSGFLEKQSELPKGITGVTVHRLAG
ncbi:hypothetical protein [Noviherbaspirillum malthae]|uniref:hypothetical protein n=1 Tax=Noviherbaspirillum malthae TaxID=1260987 RepID=UPI0018906537|nr:hypothetical protein [Noviherbaspirillum malthae]